MKQHGRSTDLQPHSAERGILKGMAERSQQSAEGRVTPAQEQEWIRKVRAGCGESARRLVESHQERLFAFVWKMIRDADAAEEICQDAFLRAFQSLDTFDPTYRFSTWLFTIGYRLCLNTLRKRRELAGEFDFSGVTASVGREAVEDDAAEMVANSEEARQMRDTIWGAVERLSTPQRATVLLFYRESMSCEEIGAVLQMPAATVKSHLHRARSKLREMLSDSLAEDWASIRFGGAAG